ncbi:hypothetical protein RP20_CCG019553 [Aedes albopictus]|nr:hypothetical protein RP20_CCG019553 [Aedes albopictus]
MESPSLDNSLPNLVDLEGLLNGLWDEQSMRDVCGDYTVGMNQWPLDGGATIVHEEGDMVTFKKEDNAVPKADQDFVESPVNNSDAVQMDQVAYGSVMLTPDASPQMCCDHDIPTVVPVSSFIPSPEYQPAVMLGNIQNQSRNSAHVPSDPQVYEINGVVVSVKQIEEEIRFNCHGAVQNIKIEPLHELQPAQQASAESAPSQAMYELANEAIMIQNPSCLYASSQNAPLNQLMITPNADNFGTQQVQDFQMITAPSTTNNETTSPFYAAQLPPGENIPTAQVASDVDTSEPSLTYSIPSTSYTQVSSLPFSNQAAMHPAPVSPAVQDTNPPESYVEVPNGYVLPAVGNGIVYPVREYYRVDACKKRSRKAKISYGIGLKCNICDQQFGKQGSLQQHVRQKHQEIRPFRCNICGKSYLTEKDMLLHRQNHDPSMKRYKCQSCDNRYRHMKDRDRHFETHHGKPTYACVIEGCPKAFARRDHMIAHVDSHRNRLEREREKARLREERENTRRQRGASGGKCEE